MENAKEKIEQIIKDYAVAYICKQCGGGGMDGSEQCAKCKGTGTESWSLDTVVEKITELMTGREWLIWSIEHRGWWAPNESGYRGVREQAGRYTFEQACNIVERANIGLKDAPNEAMILATSKDEFKSIGY